jgi:glyoxylase-like metal-dependent hydrolase (beta-lactamase superfamily II)
LNVGMGDPEELGPGLWRWTARHPEWHPGDFGAEVASYLVEAGADTLLIDPLLPDPADPVLALIDRVAADRLSVLVTIPYHVRSAEALRDRHPGEVEIWGHPAVAKRLADRRGFRAMEPGATLPGGASAHPIGRPRRFEMPIHLPSHRALAFGDAVVAVDGELRVWSSERVDERRVRWYAERFAPTLRPLLDLDLERVLVTHGEPVRAGGGAALAAALDAPPWYHRG